ncbi:hypothetical protein pb186bvf_004325 [Paramecium bursaria]
MKVQNSEIEGQHSIKQVVPLKLNKIKIIYAIVLTIFTGGLFGLALSWSKSFQAKFLFDETTEPLCTHFLIYDKQNDIDICRKNIILSFVTFKYKLLIYYLNKQQFMPLEYTSDFFQLTKPDLQQLFGLCQIEIPIIPFYLYLFQELTGPFYILQYLSVVLWIGEGFVDFAIIMMAFSFLSCIINYLLLRRARMLMKKLAQIDYQVKLENGKNIHSSELVPGDIVIVEKDQIMNCDCIIIKGDVMVNEATLTGECVPVPKGANEEQDQSSILYEGSKIVYSKECIAKVMKTGFRSLRGQYFRNVIFPEKLPLTFYVQAFKFLFVLAIIVIITFLFCLIRITIYSDTLIVIRFLDAVTWVIPPSLPIFFSATQAIANIKLLQKGIFGSNPAKTQVAGKIDTICFDKTGTLTDLNFKVIESYPEIAHSIMSCCHHLMEIDGEIQGDPLEIAMLEFTKIQPLFTKQGIQVGEYEIIKIFDFSSIKPIMTVVVQKIENKQLFAFSKGSPEVLALAMCQIQSIENRQSIEQQLEMVGYFSLENCLKSDSAYEIQKLTEIKLDVKVISGDNPITTAQCALKAQIISEISLILDYDEKNNEVITNFNPNLNIVESIQIYDNITITGPFWIHWQNLYKQTDLEFKQLIKQTKVFSRMKPIQKKEIVQALQSVGRQVMMVGDGSNDCSAIAQAQIGVSFSLSDASYTAPFSSRSTSIKCARILLLQGRSTICIIIETFQYLVTISLIKYTSAMIMMLDGQNFSDFQYQVLSYLSSIPYLIFLELSNPLEELSNSIPDDNMFSLANQLKFFNIFLINSLGLIFGGIVVNQYDSQDLKPKLETYIRKGSTNSVMFVGCLFFFNTCGITLFISKPFKKLYIYNWILTLWTGLCLFIAILSLLYNSSGGWINIIDIDSNTFDGCKYVIFIIYVSTALINYLISECLNKYFPAYRKL